MRYAHRAATLLGALLAGMAACERAPQRLSTVAQIRSLRPADADRGLPVSLTAVATHYDPLTRLLVVQDATGAISTEIADDAAPAPSAGQLVRVDAVTAALDRAIILTLARATILGPRDIPTPRIISFADLASGRHNDHWVELRGIVRAAAVQHDGNLALTIATPEGIFEASVFYYAGLEFAAVVDATVRIRGVAAAVFGARRDAIRLRLLVPTRDSVLVDEPVPVDPFAGPPYSATEISGLQGRELSSHRVRMRGTVSEYTSGRLVVADETGRIRVRVARMVPLDVGETVDVLGFPVAEQAEMILEQAIARPASPDHTRPDRAAKPARPVLATVAQVRALTPAEADLGEQVKLAGIVTYYDPVWSILFVQDATGGIYVDANGVKSFDLAPGDRVEVEGITDAGDFAPQVTEPRVRRLGRGTMPEPARVPMPTLFSGALDSQWVEVEGVVQSANEDAQHVWLNVGTGLYRWQIHSAAVPGSEALRALVDARVRVRGACGTVFNDKKQLVGVQLFVPDPASITVVRRGAADPFSLRPSSVSSLLQFSSAEATGHQVRIPGVATLVRPGRLFVREGDSGLEVRLAPGTETTNIVPGDSVDVVGFPAMGDYTPILEHASVRKTASRERTDPTRISAEDAQRGNFDAQLVSIEARVLDRVAHSTEEILTLQAGRLVFGAHLDTLGAARRMGPLRHGSLVQLTGICVVQVDSSRTPLIPRSFRLLLRSPDDVAVVDSAPWWTVERALSAGALLTAALCVAVAWAAALRRRVRQQTSVIQSRLEREAALEREYRELFENAHDAIYTHDLDGRLTSFNKAAERLTGYGRDEALTRSIEDLVVPEQRDRFRHAVRKHVAGEDVPAYEVELAARDGRRVFVEINSRLSYRGGRPEGLQSIARDVGERRRLEEQARHSQRIEAIGRLAGGVAHDFNNILNVITGYGEILGRELGANARVRPKLDEILKAAGRGAGLTRQLLAFSRKQVQELRVLDLNFVVADVEKMIARLIGEHIRLVTRSAASLGTVRADAGQIEQVLLNLAVNARDAMPQGGALTIETSNVLLDDRFAAAHPGSVAGHYVRLKVSDTGTGMDEPTRGRVFEPFFTTKERGKGTGLGLATVYGIVKQSGGYIAVESEPGQGTTFDIYLPRLDEPADERPSPVLAERQGGSETILLVEDDDVLRTCSRELLEGDGYRVLEAADGVDALEVAEQHRGRIHVLVTDMVMPRLSGRELASRLAAMRPDTKVLYVSGYSGDDLRPEDLDPVREALLSKPFTSDALAGGIRALLGVSERQRHTA